MGGQAPPTGPSALVFVEKASVDDATVTLNHGKQLFVSCFALLFTVVDTPIQSVGLPIELLLRRTIRWPRMSTVFSHGTKLR